MTKISHLAVYLRKVDPILAKAMAKINLKPHSKSANYFRSLVQSIISQQLSTKAADTIFYRFVVLFGNKFPRPSQVLKMQNNKLRKVGMSKAKVTFIKDLARRIEGGQLKFGQLRKKTDEEVISALIEVKGIGRWSAEMFLMFALQRPDVFSYGDLGLRNAMQKLYKLKNHPTPKQAEKISAKWKPHRTLACRYLWASLRIK